MNSENCVIVIMAKFPEAGKVKTRLQPFLTPNESADLAMCFLQDAVNKVITVSKNVLISYTPKENYDDFVKLLPENFNFEAQKGADLGDKLLNAFQVAFDLNFEFVVVIGTDSPTLPTNFMTNSFEILQNNDAVIGETSDGGFYLIGLKKTDKLNLKLFDQVEWSSPNTFKQTKNNFEKLNLSFFELPIFYDVDTPEDLAKLQKDQCLQQFAPITYQYFSTKKDTKL